MDVLFLTHSWPRRSGDAAGSFLLRLARALGEEGVRVRVLAPSAPGLARQEAVDGIPVQRFRYAPSRYETLAYGGNMAQLVRDSWSARAAMLGFLAAAYRATRAAARDARPSLLHAHWWYPAGLVAVPVAVRAGLPLVTTLHGTDLRIARDIAPARPLFRRVLRRSSAVTTVSRWMAAEIERLAPGTRAMVAPMPAATELFQAGTHRDPRRLLFVGRLNEQKGIELLLRAVAPLSGVTLDVIGTGEDADRLRTLAATLGLGGRVRWLGALQQPDLAPHYRSAAALVVPSRDEGLGLVAVEAMLSGTPVIAFDSGGLRDVVRDGETGVLVPVGDVAALERAIADLLADHSADRRAAMGRAARQAALEAFAPEAVARRYADLYRAVAGAATQGGR